MADAPYLIALALLEQDGSRAMPLQGKSLPSALDDPGSIGEQQLLQLLLRIWQRSDTGAIQRAAGEASLLLAELPIEVFQAQLPAIKAEWLNGGETGTFMEQLRALAGGLWSVKIEPRGPLVWTRLQ